MRSELGADEVLERTAGMLGDGWTPDAVSNALDELLATRGIDLDPEVEDAGTLAAVIRAATLAPKRMN